jgi:type II secretory pathway component GspD/PulD (secretin)
MRLRMGQSLASVILVLFMTVLGCGGGGGGTGATQYTLDVQGDLTITPTAGAQIVSKLQQQQVMIGTTIIEVTSNTAEELGVDFLDFDLQTVPEDTVDFQFILAPTVTSSGVIFKVCPLGNPYGTSYLDLSLAVTTLTGDVTFEETGDNVLIDEGHTLVIGGILRAEAEAGDRTRIPVLSNVPVISFLFQGEQHQAQVDNLLILLTPQIIADTET